MVEDSFTAGKAASYAAKKLMDDGAVNVTRKEAALISALALRYQPSVAKQQQGFQAYERSLSAAFRANGDSDIGVFGQRQQ